MGALLGRYGGVAGAQVRCVMGALLGRRGRRWVFLMGSFGEVSIDREGTIEEIYI